MTSNMSFPVNVSPKLFSGFVVSMVIGSHRFDYPKYGNLEIMYVWTGMWSTIFGIVAGVIGIKASNQPIFELKKIDNQHRSFIILVNIFITNCNLKSLA